MRRTTRRHLRDLLFRQVQAASEEAIRADGQISDEQVQAFASPDSLLSATRHSRLRIGNAGQ